MRPAAPSGISSSARPVLVTHMAFAIRTTTARGRADGQEFINAVGESASVFLPMRNAKWVEVCLRAGGAKNILRSLWNW